MPIFFQAFQQQYEGIHFSANPCELWYWHHHRRQQPWDQASKYWISQTHDKSARESDKKIYEGLDKLIIFIMESKCDYEPLDNGRC